MKCLVAEIGEIDYREALDLQSNIVSLRYESKIPNTLLLLEHPHIYTVGRRVNPSHLLFGHEEMRARGISLYSADRGGEITYHGPGQLVGYPILKIGGFTRIRMYLKALEEVLIRTFADFGIDADRLPGCPGVWYGLEKLAAIGLRVSRGISKHGFAINVSPDLSYFEGIVPCGLHDKGVTSMSEVLGFDIPLELVQKSLVKHFGIIFGFDMVFVKKEIIIGLAKRDTA